MFREIPGGPKDILVTWFYSSTPVLKPGTVPVYSTDSHDKYEKVEDKVPDLVDDTSETVDGTTPPPKSEDEQPVSEKSEPDVPVCPPCKIPGSDKRSSEEYLKMLAQTSYHQMTHKPFNPFCKYCMLNKTRAKAHKRGAFKRIIEKFGDLITGDHIEWDKSSKAVNNYHRTL